MKSTDTIVVVHEPGEPYPSCDKDWDRVNAMTEEEIHAAALADPDAQPLELLLATGHYRKLVNVRRLRERLEISQEEFSTTYRIPIGTLRDWEQRRKNMDATARAYLHVIDKDPKAVADLLAQP